MISILSGFGFSHFSFNITVTENYLEKSLTDSIYFTFHNEDLVVLHFRQPFSNFESLSPYSTVGIRGSLFF